MKMPRNQKSSFQDYLKRPHKIPPKALLVTMIFVLSISTTHAQNCNPNLTANTPDTRFQVLADGSEVKDKQTGLIWQRCSLGQTWSANKKTCTGKATEHNWQDALIKAQQVGTGYRLPNLKELSSIVERSCFPSINQTIFPNTGGGEFASGDYWSSTTYTYHIGSLARLMSFGNGEDNFRPKSFTLHVRAVR